MHFAKPTKYRLLTAAAVVVGFLLPGGPVVTLAASLVVGALAAASVGAEGTTGMRDAAAAAA